MPQHPVFKSHTIEYLRKTLIQVHNRNVRQEFLDVKGNDNSTRSALNQSCLILPKDPVGTMILRLGLFYFGLGHIDKYVVSAGPDIYDIRKEQEIPQLVLIWGQPHIKGRYKAGQYKISIPHYNGTRKPTMPSRWHKGDHSATVHLKDNSLMRLYARTEAEVQHLAAHLSQYVQPGYVQHISIGKRKGDPLKKITLHPIKAIYYPHGIKDESTKMKRNPEWIVYFDKNGMGH